MTAVADRFEGRWDVPGAEHIRLKLVRAARSAGLTTTPAENDR